MGHCPKTAKLSTRAKSLVLQVFSQQMKSEPLSFLFSCPSSYLPLKCLRVSSNNKSLSGRDLTRHLVAWREFHTY